MSWMTFSTKNTWTRFKNKPLWCGLLIKLYSLTIKNRHLISPIPSKKIYKTTIPPLNQHESMSFLDKGQLFLFLVFGLVSLTSASSAHSKSLRSWNPVASCRTRVNSRRDALPFLEVFAFNPCLIHKELPTRNQSLRLYTCIYIYMYVYIYILYTLVLYM